MREQQLEGFEPAVGSRTVQVVYKGPFRQLIADDGTVFPRRARLGGSCEGRYYASSEAVEELAAGVVRASSLVQNVNSRPRGYSFSRRRLGSDYIRLLRFYLNPRRFPRGEQEYGVAIAQRRC